MKPPNDLQHKGAAVEEWIDLHFFRPIGIRIARALLPTGVSADQVTLVVASLIGLVAGHLFVYRDPWLNAAGLALFIVSDMFDSADGQLARLRGDLDPVRTHPRRDLGQRPVRQPLRPPVVRLLLAGAMARSGRAARRSRPG